MDPLTTASIVGFVALEITKYHIKQTWSGQFLPFFIRKKTYQQRLEQVLIETIDEFRTKFPKEPDDTRILFFEDKDVMTKLSALVLFREGSVDIFASDFTSKTNVIPPSQVEIEFFYQYFIEKARKDSRLKKLRVSEQYKDEIFQISQQLLSLDIQVDQIAEKTKNIKKDTSQLIQNSQFISDAIKSIETKLGTSVDVKYQLAFAKSETQPLVENISRRSQTVNRLCEVLQLKTWLAISGGISTGKTQLSVLISNNLKLKTHWISLKEFDGKNYFFKIVSDLAVYLEIDPKERIDLILDKIETGLSEKDLIILDDIPKLEGRAKADELFLTFIRICIKKEVKIISTSNYETTGVIKNHMPKEKCEFITAPTFSESDVKEVLTGFGATEETSNRFKDFITTLSDGHPEIIVAIAKYLDSKEWRLSMEEIEDLFKGDYSAELDDSTYENILQTTRNEDSRELLYRLKLIIGDFNHTEVSKLAEVKPAIRYPIEKLHGITGLWIKKTSQNSFELSPLIKRLKSNNLGIDLSEKINYTLGEAVLEKGQVDQFDASKAILYFIAARAYNEAGFVLINVLNESLKNPELFFEWNFNTYWYKKELPEEMDVFLQMYIRTLHLMIDSGTHENSAFLREDLEKIVRSAAKKGINVGSAALLLSSEYARENPMKASQYLILGLKNYNELKELSPFKEELSQKFEPEEVLWSSALGIKSKTELENWFSVFEQLTTDQRFKATRSEMVDLASMVIGRNLIEEEQSKTVEIQNWKGLIELLQYMQRKASELGLDLIVANSMRYQINVLGEKLGMIDEAFTKAKEFLPILSENTKVQFLVKDAIGRQLFYHGRDNDALQYVAAAVELDVSEFYTEKLDTYLVISQLLGKKDQNVAHVYSKKARDFANDSQYFSETLKAKVAGEYAISLALNNKLKDAIYALGEGYQVLLDSYDDSTDSKHLVLWFGHIGNYWNHILKFNRPPEKDSSGEPYMVPKRGMLLKTFKQENIESWYFQERRFMTAHMLFSSFEELGDFEHSKKWAYNEVAINLDLTSNAFYAILQGVVPYFIIDNRYDDAIAWQSDVIEGTNKTISDPRSLESYAKSELIQDIVEDRPKIKIDRIDEIVSERVIIPIILQLILGVFDNNHKKHEMTGELIDVLERWIHIYQKQESILKVIELLRLFANGSDSESIYDNARLYSGDLIEPVKVIGYLLASQQAPTIEAFKLHFAMIQRLDTNTKKMSLGTYKFILVPFFERFWLRQYCERPTDFLHKNLWVSKSLPYYETGKWDSKLKRLFKILCFHLNYEPSNKESEWLDE